MSRKDHSAKTRAVLAKLRDDGWREARKGPGDHVQFRPVSKPGRVTIDTGAREQTTGTLRSIYRQADGLGDQEIGMQVVALIDEEGGRFGVAFPDFPGCTTTADNLDDAVAKAAEVLAFHVEGLAEDGPLPEPRTLDELSKDRQFRSDAKRAMVALVPYAPPARAVRLNITLDESLLHRVDRAAASSGKTRSGYLAEAARHQLALLGGTQPDLVVPPRRRPARTSS